MISLLRILKNNDNVTTYDFFQTFQTELPKKEPVRKPEEDQDAAEILQMARTEAEKMLQSARSECEEIQRSAFEKGMEEGRKQGKEEAYLEYQAAYEKKLQKFREEAGRFMEEAGCARERMTEQHMDALKMIAIQVAEKIIHVSLESSGTVIRNMIRSAAETLEKKQWARIHLADCDQTFELQSDAGFLMEMESLSDHIQILPSEKDEGACVLELPDMIVDASVDTQLKNITEMLMNAKG